MAGFQKDIGHINEVIVPPQDYKDYKYIPTTNNADVLAAIGQSVSDIYTSVKTGDLRQGLNQDIQDFQSKADAQSAESAQAMRELPAAIKSAADLEDTMATSHDAAAVAQSAPLLAEAKQRIMKLSSAVSAGKMDSSSMKIRAEAMMREYINRSPGLAEQFRKIYSTTMGDYNVLLAAYDAEAKNNQKIVTDYWKSIMDAADEMNLIDPTKTREELAIEVARRSGAATAAMDIQRKLEIVQHNDELHKITWRTHFTEYMSNQLTNVDTSLTQILKNPDLGQAEKVHAIDRLRASFIADINKKNAGLYSSDFIEKNITPHLSLMDIAKNKVMMKVEGAIAAADVSRYVDTAKSDLLRDPRTARFVATTQLLPIQMDLKAIPGGLDMMVDLFKAMHDNMPTRFDKNDGSPQNKQLNKGYYDLIEGQMRSNIDPKSPIKYDPYKIVRGMVNDLNQAQVGKMSTDKMEALFNKVANPDFVPLMDKALPPELLQDNKHFLTEKMNRYLVAQWIPQFNTRLHQLLQDDIQGSAFFSPATNDLMTMIGMGDSNPAEAKQEYSTFITPKVDQATGNLLFELDTKALDALSPSNKQKVLERKRLLDEKYAPRFFNMVKAKAHLMDLYKPKDYVNVATDIVMASDRLAKQK
jgi:hypothetical protein